MSANNELLSTIKGVIWVKNIRTKDGTKVFPKTLIKVLDTTFECIICKDLLKSIQMKGLKYPIEIEFNEDCYFIKKQMINRENDEVFERQTIVLTNCVSVCETTFKKVTIDEVIKAREKKGE